MNTEFGPSYAAIYDALYADKDYEAGCAMIRRIADDRLGGARDILPATIRVVQMEPGPMPTLTASAPASINARVAAPVAMPIVWRRLAEGHGHRPLTFHDRAGPARGNRWEPFPGRRD